MKRFQTVYFVIALCFFAGVRISQVGEGEGNYDASSFDLVTVFLELFTFGLLFIYGLLNRTALIRHVRQLAGPLPLIALTILSTLWSIHPPFTFRRSLVLLAGTFFGYYLGVVCNPLEIISLYRRAFLVMMTISISIILLLPSYGISHDVHSGDWKGAFPHKNRFGSIMTLTFISFVIAPTTKLPKKIGWTIGVIALALLYKTHSGTGIIIVALVILVRALLPILRQKSKLLFAILLTSLPLVAFAVTALVVFARPLLALLGKDLTFTGRVPLWLGVIHAIQLRPLLGYGYLAYYQQPEGLPVLIAELTSFKTIHSHNGYLNLMIHVGAVGLALFLLFYLRTFWRALLEVRRTSTPESRWFLIFLIYLATLNLVESQLLEPYFFNWIGLTSLAVSFAIDRSRRRHLALEEVPAEETHLLAT